MKYTPTEIPLEQLTLDPFNPRFVNIPNADEDGIKEYLIEYEGVLTIAKGINEEEGLMPGERIIVCKENGKYIVLEGNRRICACKLLFGLLMTEGRLPKVKKVTLDNITKIHVDLVDSRESIQSTLYRRHIKGIRQWPTQAKLYFFARRFQKGEDINQISSDTNSTKREVRESIQKHNLLQYTLNLPLWKQNEKDSINQTELEVDKFLRVFYSLSPRYKKNARQLLQMTFDENYSPKSELDNDSFNKGLYFLAKAAFITDTLTTRRHVENVQEFVLLYDTILETAAGSETTPSTGTDETPGNGSDPGTSTATGNGSTPGSSTTTSNGSAPGSSTTTSNGSAPGSSTTTSNGSTPGSSTTTSNGSTPGSSTTTSNGSTPGSSTTTSNGSTPGSSTTTSNGSTPGSSTTSSNGSTPGSSTTTSNGSTPGSSTTTSNGSTPSVPIFFSALQWGALNPSDPMDYGLINLAGEIKRLSENIPGRKEVFYERFPYSATIIMRSLLEQSLKFYIRKMGKWEDLFAHINKKKSTPRTDIDPTMSQLISFIRSVDNCKLLFVEKKYMSAFSTATSNENIDYMDTVVHSSEIIKPTRMKLDSIANNGMYSLISYILNDQKHWPSS